MKAGCKTGSEVCLPPLLTATWKGEPAIVTLNVLL